MGGFLDIGNSSTKTDRSNELTGFGDMKNLFNFALPAAEGNEAAAGNYAQKLLSGNRATVAQAVAPATNAINAGADAAKRQTAATTTSRGGGTAAINATADDSTRAKVDNLFMQAPQEGAQIAEGVGGTELGAATGTGANLTSIASQSRQISNSLNPGNQYLSDVTKMIGAIGGGSGASDLMDA